MNARNELTQFADYLNDCYIDRYARRSICNDLEITIIADAVSDVDTVLELMHERLGHPSPRFRCHYRDLPRSTEIDDVEKLKRFDQYTEEVRGKAIKLLGQRGVHVWHQNFDPNSHAVREVCTAVETGEAYQPKPEKGTGGGLPDGWGTAHCRGGGQGKPLTWPSE